jgi:hypothetical protein
LIDARDTAPFFLQFSRKLPKNARNILSAEGFLRQARSLFNFRATVAQKLKYPIKPYPDLFYVGQTFKTKPRGVKSLFFTLEEIGTDSENP